MKKLLSVFLSACLALQGLPLGAWALDAFEGVETAEEIPFVTQETAKFSLSEVIFTDKEWTGEGETSKIFAINREQARVDSIPYASLETAITGAVDYNKSLSPYYQKLSGKNWKFALRDNNTLFTTGDSAISDFYKPDYDVSGWHEINVPSVWQLQTDENGERYDDIRYTNTTIPWSNDATGNGSAVAPLAPTVYNPVGAYRTTFTLPENWSDKRVYINFEGVGSAMYLWVNGKAVGYAEDMFTAKEFDLTGYVKTGENVLAVKVLRWSDGSWLENQDYFRLSGIIRDVYVYCTEDIRLRDFSLSTDFDSTYTDAVLKAEAYVHNYTVSDTAGYSVKVRLFDKNGAEIALAGNISEAGTIAAGGENKITFRIPVSAPEIWTAETPNLYTAVFELSDGENVLTYDSYQVGFRKITYRKLSDGSYGTHADCKADTGAWSYDNVRLNGSSLYFKGVNRHDFSPESGYAVDYATMEKDVQLMKAHNINALRTSHYPNNPYMYYLCDKYGIYVMDEANQEASGIYDKPEITAYFEGSVVDRVDSMLYRDRNHACVVVWSYGNESGLGKSTDSVLVKMGNYIHTLDDTRPVQYEPFDSDHSAHKMTAADGTEVQMYEEAGGVDMKSSMYRTIDYMEEYGKSGKTMPYIQCEYDHAMGNSLGSFGDYWDVIRSYDNLQGGFIWDFIDQGVWTASADGTSYLGYGGDFGDSPNDGNFCANGIVSADRTVQPEIYEVERVHQNLRFEAVNLANGDIRLINENIALSTDAYTLTWEIRENNTVVQSGSFSPSVAPGKSKTVTLPYAYPTDKDGAEYFLNIHAVRKLGTIAGEETSENCRAQFELPTDGSRFAGKAASEIEELSYTEDSSALTVNGNGFSVIIDKATGRISSYTVNGTKLLDSPISPNFFKNYIDNNIHGMSTVYRILDRNAVLASSFTCTPVTEDGKIKLLKIEAKNDFLTTSSYLTTDYYILGTGEIKLAYRFTAGTADVPKIGSIMTLNKNLDTLSYFGKGPHENYNDRSRGADVGYYTANVDDLFENYIRPQDCGNRMDVRFATLTGENSDIGLMFVGEGSRLQVSASHYLPEDTHLAHHLYQCTKSENTILNIDYLVTGVGSASCGPKALPKYQIQPGTYAWSYSIRPFDALLTEEEIFRLAATDLSSLVPNNTANLENVYRKATLLADNEKTYTQSSFFAFEESYTTAGKILADSGNYSQKAVDLCTEALSAASAALKPITVTNRKKLSSDVMFGEGGTWNKPGEESYIYAFDGDHETNFVNFGNSSGGVGYGALDLGETGAAVVTSVRYLPIYCSHVPVINNRIIGTAFQGSNDKKTWMTFASISAGAVQGENQTLNAEVPGAWVELDVTDPTAYRYVRFLSPSDSYGSLYEVEFYTSETLDSSLTEEKLTQTEAFAATLSDTAVKQKLTEATSFVRTALQTGVSQLEANALYTYLCAALENAENGKTALVTGALQTLLIKAGLKNEEQYASKGFVDLRLSEQAAEKLLASADASQEDINAALLSLSATIGKLKSNVEKLTGTVFGNGGEWQPGHDYTKFFDGDTTTYVDFASPGSGTGGIDIGEGNRVSLAYIRYYPRYAEDGGAMLTRIKGEVFQASVDGEHYTTVAMIEKDATPEWITLDVSATESFRFFRINCPQNSYGSLCEIEFYAHIPDTSYLEECVSRAEAVTDNAALRTFVLSAKSMLASPRKHSQKNFNDKVFEYFSLTTLSEGRKALETAMEAFESADEEVFTSQSYLDAYEAKCRAAALYADPAASEDALFAAANELNAAVSALVTLVIKLDKAPGTDYFGQGGTWDSSAECFDKQFDGDISTYTDYAGTMDGIGGFDSGEGAASVPTKLRFYLRTGVGNRYNGTRFEASADNESWTTLYTVPWNATAGEWIEITFDGTESYRYFRVYSPKDTFGSVCEAEFYGTGKDKSLLRTTLANAKAVTGSGVYYEALQAEIANAETLMSSPAARMHDINASILALRENIAKLSASDAYANALAKAEKVDEDLYTAESYFAFKAARDAALAAATAYQMTATAAALEEKIASLLPLSTLSPVKLDKAPGTAYFGDGGTWNKPDVQCYDKLFDGDLATYIDFASPGSGSGGFDAGNAVALSHIRYYPRYGSGMNDRIKNTLFQGSNDKETWTTLATITQSAKENTWFELPVSDTGKYRYLRVLCPTNSFGSLCEAEFYGYGSDLSLLKRAIADAKAKLAESDSAALAEAVEAAEALTVTSRQSEINKAYTEILRLSTALDRVTVSFVCDLAVTGNIDSYTVNAGETVYLPDHPYTDIPDGFTFEGWTDGKKLYKAYEALTAGHTDLVFKAVWRTDAAVTFSEATVRYVDGYATLTFDKPIGKECLTAANFGTGLSYVGYGENTNTVRVYIDYKSVKLGKSFTVSVKNLSDYAHGYVYDCTGQRTYTLENTPTYTPGGNHIPNGSFDLPYATDYFDGQITPRDGDGYMLFVPRSEVGWNYVRWNVNFESGKRYYLEYDAKAGKDADGNALSAATVNCAANVGGDRMLTGTIVSSSAWSHVEYLIPAELNMTEWFGIYSNPEGGKSISYFLDNVSLKEAFTAAFTAPDGETVAETYTLPAGKERVMPTLADGYVWSDGETIYLPGESYVTPAKAVSYTAVPISPVLSEKLSMRTSDQMGIRFKASVSARTRFYCDEYGLLVTRDTLLSAANLADEDFTKDAAVKMAVGKAYQKGGVDYVSGMTADGDYEFTAAIVGIPFTKEACTEKIVVRPYVLIGQTAFYGNVRKASLADAANAVKNHPDYTENDYVEKVLELCK